jgi:hypothetical protein
MLTWRGSAPPLLEQPSLDVEPTLVQLLGAAEALDLHNRVRVIDHQLVSATVVNGPHFAPDDAVCAAEETHHVPSIGTANPGNRGQNRGLRAQGSRLRVPEV